MTPDNDQNKAYLYDMCANIYKINMLIPSLIIRKRT